MNLGVRLGGNPKVRMVWVEALDSSSKLEVTSVQEVDRQLGSAMGRA